MSQYLEWNGKGAIPIPNIAPNTWPQFMSYSERFHSCEPCMEALNNHVKFILGRTNAYTKRKYTEDNTIMAWQVGNEPRTFTAENEKNIFFSTIFYNRCNCLFPKNKRIQVIVP